jgi:predicted transcriptional regulator
MTKSNGTNGNGSHSTAYTNRLETTGDRVLAALEPHRARARGRYNIPWRDGSDSGALAVTIDPDGEHGAYTDHVTGESGSLYELADRLGVSQPEKPTENPPRRARKPAAAKLGPVVATYTYVDSQGAPLYQVTRHNEPDKAYIPRDLSGKAGFPKDTPRYLYKLPDVLEAVTADETVLFVEGEKTCEALQGMGFVVTAIMGGAKGTWYEQYTTALAGGRVVILPDNDDPGREFAARVAGELYDHAGSIQIVNLPGLGEGCDPENWRADGGTVAQLNQLIADTPRYTPPLFNEWLTPEQAKQLPPTEWLIDGLIPKGGLCGLIGDSGTGKTFYALDLAAQAADRAPVMFVVTEGADGFPKRIRAWEQHHHRAMSPDMRHARTTKNLLDIKEVHQLIYDARHLKPGLIVFDTLSNSMPGGDENSSKDMTTLIAHCNLIREATGAAILLVHHTTKDGKSYRGHSSLKGAMDMMIEMSGSDRVFTVKCAKSKDSEPFQKQHLKLLPVADTDSCVLVPSSKIDRRYDKSLTERETDALEIAALEVYQEAGVYPRHLIEQADIPKGTVGRVLSTLTSMGYLKQAEKGEPYYITQQGKEYLKSRGLS